VDGKLAEAVLLTSHVRVAFANIQPFTLSREHPSFAGTASLTFEIDDGQGWSGAATQVASSLAGWFEYLQASAARACGLVGGVLCVSGPAGERVWRQSMDVVKPRPADGRIWAVRYREFDAKAAWPQVSLEASAARLLEVLVECQALAHDAAEAGWAKFFDNARHELNPPTDSLVQASHLLPALGYSAAAQRLLRGCELAWAFGGMGSWNDLDFADVEHRRRYGRLTPQLKTAVLEGICAAVNSELNTQ